MASSEQPQSQEQISQWMQNVHDAHSKRSPQAVEEARQRAEQARTMEQQYRKCKAVKSHAFRSRSRSDIGLFARPSAEVETWASSLRLLQPFWAHAR
mmetsp:Transcript_179878/g.570630  ORF Transcript_179878/g.570630 Transcript_179878/m.570630 type:complete len:97 (-) Transcript_179878:706-996(-)